MPVRSLANRYLSAGISSNTLQTEAKTAEEMKSNLFDNKDSNIEDWVNTYRTNVPQCFFMTLGFLSLLQKSTEHQHGYSGCVINVSRFQSVSLSAYTDSSSLFRYAQFQEL